MTKCSQIIRIEFQPIEFECALGKPFIHFISNVTWAQWADACISSCSADSIVAVSVSSRKSSQFAYSPITVVGRSELISSSSTKYISRFRYTGDRTPPSWKAVSPPRLQMFSFKFVTERSRKFRLISFSVLLLFLYARKLEKRTEVREKGEKYVKNSSSSSIDYISNVSRLRMHLISASALFAASNWWMNETRSESWYLV